MPYAWEELGYEDIRDKTQRTVLDNLQSGWDTLVSGTISGESKYLVNVKGYTSYPLSAPIVYVRAIDAKSGAHTIGTLKFSATSGYVIGNVESKIGGEDPRCPIFMVDGPGACIQARGSTSGITTLEAMWWVQR